MKRLSQPTGVLFFCNNRNINAMTFNPNLISNWPVISGMLKNITRNYPMLLKMKLNAGKGELTPTEVRPDLHPAR
ncbi:MAG TPA: hypothetical protein VFU15_10730 [Bacteroidia bacterium]|nr:hypothetical protein [Bacteroidia bacterium]